VCASEYIELEARDFGARANVSGSVDAGADTSAPAQSPRFPERAANIAEPSMAASRGQSASLVAIDQHFD
jgi:hypothetical protein